MTTFVDPNFHVIDQGSFFPLHHNNDVTTRDLTVASVIKNKIFCDGCYQVNDLFLNRQIIYCIANFGCYRYYRTAVV